MAEELRDIEAEFADAIESAADKLYPIFQMYGWTWVTASSDNGIPTRDDIIDKLTGLTDTAKKKGNAHNGRLSVRIDERENVAHYKISLDLNSVFYSTSRPTSPSQAPLDKETNRTSLGEAQSMLQKAVEDLQAKHREQAIAHLMLYGHAFDLCRESWCQYAGNRHCNNCSDDDVKAQIKADK